MPWGVPNCFQIEHDEVDVGEGINLRLVETRYAEYGGQALWLLADNGHVEQYFVNKNQWIQYNGLWCESLGYPRTGPVMPNTQWFTNNRPPSNYATLRKGGKTNKKTLHSDVDLRVKPEL